MEEVAKWFAAFGASAYGGCFLIFWAVNSFNIWWSVKRERETYNVGTLVAMLIVSIVPFVNILIALCIAGPHFVRLMNVTVFGRKGS